MPNWKSIFQDLKTSEKKFTVYLRYMQKETLAKIPNVTVNEIYEDHIKLENPSGYGVLGYEDILYISIPRQ
ncbi:hypothetical protein EU537_09330 [Candidatus Thorarchaeota archaeon]|nr:MAG: hypothetical protein EU537_09330 [Candidatus Thorarchaeota archaeon]